MKYLQTSRTTQSVAGSTELISFSLTVIYKQVALTALIHLIGGSILQTGRAFCDHHRNFRFLNYKKIVPVVPGELSRVAPAPTESSGVTCL